MPRRSRKSAPCSRSMPGAIRASGSSSGRRTGTSRRPPTPRWRWRRASSSSCSTMTTNCRPMRCTGSRARSSSAPAPNSSIRRDKIDENGMRFDPLQVRLEPGPAVRAELRHHLAYTAPRACVLGGFRPGLEGAQDWDLALRVSEGVAAACIGHSRACSTTGAPSPLRRGRHCGRAMPARQQRLEEHRRARASGRRWCRPSTRVLARAVPAPRRDAGPFIRARAGQTPARKARA
jgi:hypothetical protein